MAVAASFSVRSDAAGFDEWHSGRREVRLGNARDLIRDSEIGQQIERDGAPHSIFGLVDGAWMNTLYMRLCAYAHSRPGFNNGDFWRSNGPIFVRSALSVVESDCRETVAVRYLLARISWPAYSSGDGQIGLLAGDRSGWEQYEPTLARWLLGRR